MNAVIDPRADSTAHSSANAHDPSDFGHVLGVTCGILCPLVAVFSLVLSLVVGFDMIGSVGFALFTTLTAGFGFALIIAGAVYGSGVMESEHEAIECHQGRASTAS